MDIKIIQYNDKFIADMVDLPGSPPIGEGRTEYESVAYLFFRLLQPNIVENWRKYMDFSNLSVDVTAKVTINKIKER
jgi:hypothetical protein